MYEAQQWPRFGSHKALKLPTVHDRMHSQQNNFSFYLRNSRDILDGGGIFAGRSRLSILAALVVTISGLALPIWSDASVSASRKPDPPQLPDPSALELLERAQLPPADLAELATRLGGHNPIDKAFPAPAPAPSDLGARQVFWVSNMHGNRFQVETTLRLATAHGRIWVQDDLDMDDQRLEMLGVSLEEQIYPKVLLLLGDQPLANEMPVEFVFTDRLGPRLAGYFSPRDRIHSEISETSNARRMILLNVELAQDQDQLARLVTHELQHLLHWELDSNESVWIQEGFSGFAERLLGYDREARVSAYLSAPDLQLNAWPLEGPFALHYGAASLLINYLYDRFGPEFVSALARNPADGLEALDVLLLEANWWDSGRNRVLTTEDVVLDWGIANFLQLDSGPYAYADQRDLPSSLATEFIGRCKENSSEHRVSQYGFDYIRIRCDKARVIEISGGRSTKLLPTAAHSGQYFFWSNRGSLIDTRMTRQFDFTEVEGPLTLQFWSWYELEKGSDFVYLLATEDGQHWSFLETTSGNPVGDAVGGQLGFGFSGINRRNEWSRQTVDLSRFAGKRVTLRFEYVTNSTRAGEGFLIDDISVVETNYESDFEDGPGGWHGEGFLRISDTIPQDFRVSIIRLGESVSVEQLILDDSNRVRVSLEPGEEVLLVIMGATRHTRQPAHYMLSLWR